MLIQAHNLDIPSAALRFCRNGRIDRRVMYDYLVENRTLREDATRHIEETLLRVARRDLIAMRDIAQFQRPLDKGIGSTTFEYDKITPVREASQGMSILDLGERDKVQFARTAIPVPVTAATFRLDARELAAGRGMGESIDLTNIEENVRSVAEKLDDTLVNGSDVVLGTNTLTGYTNFGCRTQITAGTAWNDLTAGALQPAVAEVLAAKAALRADGFTGPYMLYIPENYEGVIDDDYKDESDATLRERILRINGIQGVEVLPQLSDDEVVLVQMTRSVVEIGMGQNITVVTWDEKGGLATHWAVLAVLTFALKCAYARAPLASGVLPTLGTAAGIAHIA